MLLRPLACVMLAFAACATACIPADPEPGPVVVAVPHEQYPDFEEYSDTQDPVLTGTGAQADWEDDAQQEASGDDQSASTRSDASSKSTSAP